MYGTTFLLLLSPACSQLIRMRRSCQSSKMGISRCTKWINDLRIWNSAKLDALGSFWCKFSGRTWCLWCFFTVVKSAVELFMSDMLSSFGWGGGGTQTKSLKITWGASSNNSNNTIFFWAFPSRMAQGRCPSSPRAVRRSEGHSRPECPKKIVLLLLLELAPKVICQRFGLGTPPTSSRTTTTCQT